MCSLQWACLDPPSLLMLLLLVTIVAYPVANHVTPEQMGSGGFDSINQRFPDLMEDQGLLLAVFEVALPKA